MQISDEDRNEFFESIHDEISYNEELGEFGLYSTSFPNELVNEYYSKINEIMQLFVWLNYVIIPAISKEISENTLSEGSSKNPNIEKIKKIFEDIAAQLKPDETLNIEPDEIHGLCWSFLSDITKKYGDSIDNTPDKLDHADFEDFKVFIIFVTQENLLEFLIRQIFKSFDVDGYITLNIALEDTASEIANRKNEEGIRPFSNIDDSTLEGQWKLRINEISEFIKWRNTVDRFVLKDEHNTNDCSIPIINDTFGSLDFTDIGPNNFSALSTGQSKNLKLKIYKFVKNNYFKKGFFVPIWKADQANLAFFIRFYDIAFFYENIILDFYQNFDFTKYYAEKKSNLSQEENSFDHSNKLENTSNFSQEEKPIENSDKSENTNRGYSPAMEEDIEEVFAKLNEGFSSGHLKPLPTTNLSGLELDWAQNYNSVLRFYSWQNKQISNLTPREKTLEYCTCDKTLDFLYSLDGGVLPKDALRKLSKNQSNDILLEVHEFVFLVLFKQYKWPLRRADKSNIFVFSILFDQQSLLKFTAQRAYADFDFKAYYQETGAFEPEPEPVLAYPDDEPIEIDPYSRFEEAVLRDEPVRPAKQEQRAKQKSEKKSRRKTKNQKPKKDKETKRSGIYNKLFDQLVSHYQSVYPADISPEVLFANAEKEMLKYYSVLKKSDKKYLFEKYMAGKGVPVLPMNEQLLLGGGQNSNQNQQQPPPQPEFSSQPPHNNQANKASAANEQPFFQNDTPDFETVNATASTVNFGEYRETQTPKPKTSYGDFETSSEDVFVTGEQSLVEKMAIQFKISTFEATEILRAHRLFASSTVELRLTYSIQHIEASESYLLKKDDIGRGKKGVGKMFSNFINTLEKDVSNMWQKYGEARQLHKSLIRGVETYELQKVEGVRPENVVTQIFTMRHEAQDFKEPSDVMEGRRIFDTLRRHENLYDRIKHAIS